MKCVHVHLPKGLREIETDRQKKIYIQTEMDTDGRQRQTNK